MGNFGWVHVLTSQVRATRVSGLAQHKWNGICMVELFVCRYPYVPP